MDNMRKALSHSCFLWKDQEHDKNMYHISNLHSFLVLQKNIFTIFTWNPSCNKTKYIRMVLCWCHPNTKLKVDFSH